MQVSVHSLLPESIFETDGVNLGKSDSGIGSAQPQQSSVFCLLRLRHPDSRIRATQIAQHQNLRFVYALILNQLWHLIGTGQVNHQVADLFVGKRPQQAIGHHR